MFAAHEPIRDLLHVHAEVTPGHGHPGVHFQKTRKEKFPQKNLPYKPYNHQQVHNSGNPVQFGQVPVTYQGKNYRRFDNFKQSVREDTLGQDFVTIDRPSSFPKNQKK